MKLSVAYKIPGILGKILDGLFVGKVVENTLQADLERFKVYALEQARLRADGASVS